MYLGFGVAMHIGIQLGVYVVFFSPMIVSSYVCFLTSDDLRGVLGWPGRMRQRWRARGSMPA